MSHQNAKLKFVIMFHPHVEDKHDAVKATMLPPQEAVLVYLLYIIAHKASWHLPKINFISSKHQTNNFPC